MSAVFDEDGLRKVIKAIEDKAPELGTDKVALYDLLIVAYYHQKDLIALLEAKQPQKEIVEDTDKIDQLTFELEELKKKLEVEVNDKNAAMSQLDKIAEIITVISEE